MNGPEHYREAERLLEMVGNGPPDWFQEHGAATAAAAQAHATLALVAASVAPRALGPQEPWGGHTLDALDQDWREATA